MKAGEPGSAPVGETFELVALAGGVQSLRSLVNGQTFHPVVGPAVEAARLHLGGSRLRERMPSLASAGRECVVWDIGLGAAANALAAVAAFEDGPGDLRLLSFDSADGALRFAIGHAEALRYPVPFASLLTTLRDDGCATLRNRHGATLHWEMHLADFPGLLARAGRDELPAPHAVFFDPYSPDVNPTMWTLELFTALRARMSAEAPCLLTNYTRSTAVRVTLSLAGFFVGIGPSTGEKDETTVAANSLALLERPLAREWLEKKVAASTNAAPLRAGSAPSRGPISDEDFERLRAHAQFA